MKRFVNSEERRHQTMLKVKLITILLIAIAVADAGETASDDYFPIPSNNSRIIGGRPAKNSIPYQASLQLKNKSGKWIHFCGGSIISKSYILTAAHCVVGLKSTEKLSVAIGSNRLSSAGTNAIMRHMVIRTKMHEHFKELVTSDIAVLKVSPDIVFNGRTISKINFAPTKLIGSDIPVYLTGWGSTGRKGNGPFPNDLQILKLHTLNNAECKKRGIDVTKTEICAFGARNQGSCAGDSGGPLVNNDRTLQIGVVAYGTKICASGVPDAYTRISAFSKWIERQIAI